MRSWRRNQDVPRKQRHTAHREAMNELLMAGLHRLQAQPWMLGVIRLDLNDRLYWLLGRAGATTPPLTRFTPYSLTAFRAGSGSPTCQIPLAP